MKICVLGCGLRTPLLIHGLAQATRNGLKLEHLSLYDTVAANAALMVSLGEPLLEGHSVRLHAATSPEAAIEGSSFVVSSFRAGGMQQRARDERTCFECGYTGQETVGPAGMAMALRTVPVALEYAAMTRRLAPQSWIINFTNPAGLITQAIQQHEYARTIGICDTPEELFFRISLALEAPLDKIECEYFGLNHLGWIRRVVHNGHDRTPYLFADDARLNGLYPGPLFPPAFLRALHLLPTEYLYFYYRPRAAHANQKQAGATRGEELLSINETLFNDLRDTRGREALHAYTRYLNRRNASYLKLESEAGSALTGEAPDWDPFAAATGYHRIAVATIQALAGAGPPTRIVLNVRNNAAMPDLAPADVVEIPCVVDSNGVHALSIGPVPAAVVGLIQAVKTYERHTIRAARERDPVLAALALSINPLVGEWTEAERLVAALNPPAEA